MWKTERFCFYAVILGSPFGKAVAAGDGEDETVYGSIVCVANTFSSCHQIGW